LLDAGDPVLSIVNSIDPSSAKEPLNIAARSAFQSEKVLIVCCGASDSSRSYGRMTQRARGGFSSESLSARVFAGSPARLCWLRRNNRLL